MAIGQETADQRLVLPDPSNGWMIKDGHVARAVSSPIPVSIRGVGEFTVDPELVETQRPDVFQSGRLSVYDLVAHLGARGDIELVAHFDDALATHVIESIDGQDRWWYEARYSGGWFERNVTRMDLYPVKDGTIVRLERIDASRWLAIHESFAAEVQRWTDNDERIVIPSVTIEGPRGEPLSLEDVDVRAHDVRPDLFQPGVVTALDILLSLGEDGRLSELGLTWWSSIGTADPVEHYFVERIDAPGFHAEAAGGCGFVYEVGPRAFSGFRGSHIHIPTDARVIISPDYALWFWLCL
jgi:hypothetical protein